MAIIRKKELRTMDPQALNDKLAELRKELGVERSAVASSGKASNSGRMREMKKTVARILTILKSKEVKVTKEVTQKNG